MTPQHPNMKLLLVAGKLQSEGSDGEKGYRATQCEAGGGKEGDFWKLV